MAHNDLIPYAVVVDATQGDPIALNRILRHYDALITQYSKRNLFDEYGNTYTVIDRDLKNRISARLMLQITCDFDPTRQPVKDTSN